MRANNFVLLLVAAFIGAWIFIPSAGQGYDMVCFRDWTIFIRANGLGRAYEVSGLDYNPLYLELLWLFGRLKGSVEDLNASFFTFKLLVLLFHFGAVALAAHLLNKRGRNIALACFLLLNPALLYNTVIWGQVDAIFSMFVAFSIFFATRKQVLGSLLCIQLAVNFKLIAVIFVPVIVLLNLPAIRQNWRVLLRVLPLLLAIQLLILLPFLNRAGLQAILAANVRQFRVSSAASPSGFNYWYLVLGGRAFDVQASQTFLRVSFKAWGVVLFALSTAMIFLPLFRATILKKKPVDDARVFLASALYGLAFFFFTTGMHERYSHAAILLLAFYAVLEGNYASYVIASIAYFLNMEKGTTYFHVNSYDTMIFRSSFVAGLFAIVLLGGIARIWFELLPRPHPSERVLSEPH